MEGVKKYDQRGWHWEVIIISWRSVKVPDTKDYAPELASAHTQNTKEQEGEFTQRKVGIRGKNQEDIFKQLLQNNSTSIYWASSMGKQLDWLLWRHTDETDGAPLEFSGQERWNTNESNAKYGAAHDT